MKYAKIRQAKNNRYAVLVRKDIKSPWVQVDSCYTHKDAEEMIDMYSYENDSQRRCRDANNYENEDWGDDAPKERGECQ